MCHTCCSNHAHNMCRGAYVYYPYPVFYPQPPVCPCCGMFAGQCTCNTQECCDTVTIPQEISADNTNKTKNVFVGGLEDANLTLEYIPITAGPTANVKVTITGQGGTTVWDTSDIAAGYYIKDDFAPVAPGSTIKLEVNDCMARLRWCEDICC